MRSTLLCLILFLVPAVTFASDPNADKLIGHWRFTNEMDGVSCDITFQSGGTYLGSCARKGNIIWKYEGIWSLQGQILNYEDTASSLPDIPPGTKDQDKLIEITKGYFIIEASGGAKRKYIRVD